MQQNKLHSRIVDWFFVGCGAVGANAFLIQAVSIGVTILLVRLFLLFVMKHSAKAELKEKNDKSIRVRVPRLVAVLGVFTVAFVCAAWCITVMQNQFELWVGIVCSVFLFIGFYLVFYALLWQIELPSAKECFLFRSMFGRKREIEYKDCIYYKESKNGLIIKTTNHTIYVEPFVIHYRDLCVQLNKHRVPERFPKPAKKSRFRRIGQRFRQKVRRLWRKIWK